MPGLKGIRLAQKVRVTMKARFPVFVLKHHRSILYPHAAVPLFIDNEFDIHLIHESIQSGIPIALCRDFDELGDGSVIAGFGTASILQSQLDGSLIVLLSGMGKAKIVEIKQQSPFLVAEAEKIVDNNRVRPEMRFRLNRLRKKIIPFLSQSEHEDSAKTFYEESLKTPEILVESLAILMIEERDVRQEILEEDDINEKIEFLSKYLG